MCKMPDAGGHPLGRAVLNDAAPADGVLVQERAVDHVGHGLEAAVRVPRRALGLARAVVDLTHLVHVHERVEVGHVDAGEGSANREALAFEAARRRVMDFTRRGRSVVSGLTALASSSGLSTEMAGIGPYYGRTSAIRTGRRRALDVDAVAKRLDVGARRGPHLRCNRRSCF